MVEREVSRNKKNARLNGAIILFEDEVLFQQEGTIRQSWARRGVGFSVFKYPCKRKIKFYGAVSIERYPRFHFQKVDWFNAKSFEKFLKTLLKSFDKIYLILDNARYHKAKELKPFLDDNKEHLSLYFLPSYSPELNAVEAVWKNTRKDATHNRYFPKIKRLTRAVHTRFRIYQNEPSMLAGIIKPFL